MSIREISFPSANGRDTIKAWSYSPLGEPKAVVQIMHGFGEHSRRYLHMISAFLDADYIVAADDHVGHGKTALENDTWGNWGEKGCHTMMEDEHTLKELVCKMYPDLPYFLFGHSMGSFAARAYAAKYGRCLDGLILCGTSGGESAADAGLALARSLSAVKGDHYRSEKIQQMLFGVSNFKVEEKRTEFDWVSRDKEIVAKYILDPKCNFTFTVRGYYDLIMLLEYVSSEDWAEKIRKHLPILLISGDMDPVGGYGKGVRRVFERLTEAGVQNVSIKLYEGARHELINEINRSEVYGDVLDWINSVI